MNRRQAIASCCNALGALVLARVEAHAQILPGGAGRGGTGRSSDKWKSSRGEGCYLSANDGRALAAQTPLLSRTCGVPWLDQMMPIEAQYLSRYFGVRAGFTFLVDAEGANAFATPDAFFPNTGGTVLFGVQLLQQELSASQFGTIALAAIMAHEWGHILQFAHGIRVPGKRMELSSDFMAGWWCGMKVLANTPVVDMQTVARSLYAKGDYAFNDPAHHGTPPERVEQMALGFSAAVEDRVTDSRAAFALSRESVGL